MLAQHRSDALLRDAARRCDPANLQCGISRADMRVETGAGCRQHVGEDRLAGELGFGLIQSLAVCCQSLRMTAITRLVASMWNV